MTPKLKALPPPTARTSDPDEPEGDPFTRDLIAMVAMHALIAHEPVGGDIAHEAYKLADAMLDERSKP